ncbi:HemK2/MTQ2 family protein methyltransferase [Halocatena pleomorpha]|uniref:Methyltransferase domain-containing protein n=1 Tax=Halocatena pleomorpha TaxID=1785090 RepID=A0A3P3RJ83_9EURY|nr:HemK2/MTQ2 family protein methyltransferase [Halocatena pleomorpha]RRJ33445.1 methyltransferase domain-containing protein [Halocatena pleomorpha]
MDVTDLREQRDIEQVYQPAEDSHLLATTACEHICADDRVLDVGTGSGYVAATVQERTGATVVGTDVNPHACRQARDHGVDVVRTDLVSGICGSFDVVLCNPPYLPTDPDEEWDDWMEYALSGGPTGRAVINDVLDALRSVLSPSGRAYLLVSTLSDLDAVTERANENNCETTIIEEESVPFETLVVFEITLKH